MWCDIIIVQPAAKHWRAASHEMPKVELLKGLENVPNDFPSFTTIYGPYNFDFWSFASDHVMGQCRSITGKPQNGARDFWVDVAKQLYFRLVIPER